ncbi:hypothetical protein CPC08DRAFT_717802 [Agrocybe pediades]|nr:hypothetical protein CPC08DRAFT_717802 [Agrocybe pediades]
MLLNDDILLLVFSTISNIRDVHVEHRQATIRCASPVCQRWRNLILVASYIWGKLLWVNSKQNMKWMADVLERAKRVTLVSMTLEPRLYNDYVIPFFKFRIFVLRVLEDTWERLEELEINIRDFNRSCHVQKAIWQYAKTPAPKLRVFALSSGMDIVLQQTLFNNSAPLLQSFTCANLPPPSSSWLSHITTLKFTPDTVNDILNAVSWVPYLQVLHLGSQGNKDHVYISLEDCERVASMSPTILVRLARVDMLFVSFDEFNPLFSSRYQSPAEAYSHIVIAFEEQAPPQFNYSGFRNSLSNFFYHHAGITTSNTQNYDLEWKVEADYAHIFVEVKACRVPELYMQLYFDFCFRTDPDEFRPFLARAIAEYARHTKKFYLSVVGNLKEYERLETFDFCCHRWKMCSQRRLLYPM